VWTDANVIQGFFFIELLHPAAHKLFALEALCAKLGVSNAITRAIAIVLIHSFLFFLWGSIWVVSSWI